MSSEQPLHMHIALCGPATISLLEPWLGVKIPSAGYPFALLPALAEQLIAAGHRVTIVSTATDIDTPVKFVRHQLGLVLVPSRPRAKDRALSFFRSERRGIAAALRELRPDVIHAHWTYEFALGAAEAAVAPVLVTAHDSPLKVFALYLDSYRFFRLLLGIRARMSIRHISAPSPNLARQLRWLAHFGSVPVIPNLVSPPLEVSAGVGPKSTVKVLCVASSGRPKNVHALLRAMPLVRAQHPDARLRLVGNGLERGASLEAWARLHRLDTNVDFVGYVDRLALTDEYARASVFCSPSIEESFGITLIEALHAGLPVIAGKNSGAVPWVLFDGQAGKLVDIRDPAAIANAISDAIDEPSTTVAAGFDVAAAINERYSPSAVAAQFLAEYRRVIAMDLDR